MDKHPAYEMVYDAACDCRYLELSGQPFTMWIIVGLVVTAVTFGLLTSIDGGVTNPEDVGKLQGVGRTLVVGPLVTVVLALTWGPFGHVVQGVVGSALGVVFAIAFAIAMIFAFGRMIGL